MRRVLDGRYQILETIGHGRFAKYVPKNMKLSYRVKKAVDLTTGREVAVKILRFLRGDDDTIESRKDTVESFFQEISILSYCKHPNIVKLLNASFNGTLLKEEVQESQIRKPSVEQSAIVSHLDNDEGRVVDTTSMTSKEESIMTVVKRKTNVCYCVLKLASKGELYKLVESTERFSEDLTRSLFVQLINGKLSDIKV